MPQELLKLCFIPGFNNIHAFQILFRVTQRYLEKVNLRINSNRDTVTVNSN